MKLRDFTPTHYNVHGDLVQVVKSNTYRAYSSMLHTYEFQSDTMTELCENDQFIVRYFDEDVWTTTVFTTWMDASCFALAAHYNGGGARLFKFTVLNDRHPLY